MNLGLVGLNHRTAPVDVREQLAFSREGVATALFLFCKRFPQAEAAIVSTCNRVELIYAAEGDRPTPADVTSFIAEARDVPVRAFEPYLYQHTGEKAVRHLFRVAASLDSMVVGEYQIVNQIKTAYAQASEQGAVGRTLNRLFHMAFGVAKRIRTETEIGLRKVSVPSVAVDVARSIFSDFAGKRVLVLGAGDMSQIVCQHLRKADAANFTVASRTSTNARALAAACGGRQAPWAEVDGELAGADIVITATSCPKPIITIDKLRKVQAERRGKPMFFIDLAVPRNVEPGCEKIAQVYVYDVDALGRIIEQNQQHRAGQVELCEAILDQEVEQFGQWRRQSKAQPVIEQMFIDARAVRDAEVARTLAATSGLNDEQRRAVEELADRLIGKFMHPCVGTVKHCSACSEVTNLPLTLHEVARRTKPRPPKGNGRDAR